MSNLISILLSKLYLAHHLSDILAFNLIFMEMNRAEVLRESLNSGLRVFFDEDQESYFDLSVERLPDSEFFEVQISFSSPSDIDKGKGIPASEDQIISPVDQQALLEDSIEILGHVSCLDLKILNGCRSSNSSFDDGLFSCKPRCPKPKTLRYHADTFALHWYFNCFNRFS